MSSIDQMISKYSQSECESDHCQHLEKESVDTIEKYKAIYEVEYDNSLGKFEKYEDISEFNDS